MSDEAKKPEEATPPVAEAPEVDTEIKNLKSEMNRKMSNLEQTNAQLMQQLQAMLQPKQPATPAKKVSVFEDEDAFAHDILTKAEQIADAKLAKRESELAKQQATISTLVYEFPELASSDHALTKKALDVYNAMSAEEKISPVAYKAAVREAALDLGVKPKSKRSSDDGENFSLSATPKTPPTRKNERSELDPKTEMFAQLMGVELTKEVKERMVNNHGRKTYSKWQ